MREKRVERRGVGAEDIEEAQELPVDPARRSWRMGGSAIPVGAPVPVALHLFARLVLQEPVGSWSRSWPLRLTSAR